MGTDLHHIYDLMPHVMAVLPSTASQGLPRMTGHDTGLIVDAAGVAECDVAMIGIETIRVVSGRVVESPHQPRREHVKVGVNAEEIGLGIADGCAPPSG